ncbi:MAG: type II toxin-antitoxin system VapC family toxin [Candidatus Sulfotelmatobacter sp.]|jgi:ribonuclease VapC
MVIDTSALAAIFFHEPERDVFRNAIVAASSRLISAATVLEAGMVIEGRRGGGAGREFDLFIVRAQIKIVPIDAELADLARSAWRKYGKGRHPAGLNFGDCFSYALAKATGEPLLAKGTDFTKTDALIHS